MGIILFPWGIVSLCYKNYQEAHEPPGHVHGLCKLRKTFKGTAYWPPMDCPNFKLDVGKYQTSDHEISIKPPTTTLVVFAVLSDIIQLPAVERKFPETRAPPNAKSPPLQGYSPRGSPFV